jgi:hypothetical protein
MRHLNGSSGPGLSPASTTTQSPDQPRTLFLAAPNYKGASGSFILSVLSLQYELSLANYTLWPWIIENESNIDRARGKACAAFLKTDATHLLFADTDQGFRGPHIVQMMKLNQSIIGGVTCQKQFHFEHMIKAARAYPDMPTAMAVAFGTSFNFSEQPEGWDLSQLQPVRRVGTGLMLIRRDVIETLWATHAAELGAKHGDVYFVNLFQCTIDRLTGEQIGTDYSFCDRAAEAGFPTYLAPWVNTTHRGDYTFNANLMDLCDVTKSAGT